ncbi:MAG: translation initiation factor IF-3 [Thermoleophilia bacterium]
MRLIDADGENRGVVRLAEAQDIAANAGLDLVEVAPDARPPVCRIMDYGKWRYEQEQKAKQARRHQSTITIKEIKFRPKIDPHDYATKKGHVERFLRHRDKVKITIMFRGRELLHPERGEAILLRLAEELSELAIVESRPNLDGRNMVMMLAPVKNPAAGEGEGNGRPRRDPAAAEQADLAEQPDVAEQAEVPEQPDVPEQAEVPVQPDAPEEPAVAEQPAAAPDSTSS